ncbi:ATPase [Bordetella sp. H567]|uniref:sensor histidine kinase n=1 Tax=Bordetella sp. H567 TaxID=1697043 RepID=UPI00081C8C5B|nr:HAMP domain-containing sensor histidine kinase [Bordetella sp. H567]AOB30033.1 ATPase [Bordetella sp. H567]
MSAHSAARRFALWPRTLVVRLFVIFLIGLVVAQALSMALLFYERYEAGKSMMLGNLESDVSIAMDILDRLPAAERPAWLPRLGSTNRVYLLRAGEADQPLTSSAARSAADAIRKALRDRDVAVREMAGDPKHIQAIMRLRDGSPVTLDIHLSLMPMAMWLPLVLALQLMLLVGCAWYAVRLAVRPLTQLAHAADTLDPNQTGPRLTEHGPTEVAHAATAFNAMQDRIAAHLAERMRILGAISHDLQTPITRMKLRAELMEESMDKAKLAQDLDEVERLVREGLAYARTAHGALEKPARLDICAFLDSLACDYQDTGKDVSLTGTCAAPMTTRPHALRRLLGNLIDNALKYGGGAAEVHVEPRGDGGLTVSVMDRGPGIPDDKLQDVLQPFYRLEGSRNRDTGGTGLGLAIASQLAAITGGTLALHNREGGGLCAELRLAGLE